MLLVPLGGAPVNVRVVPETVYVVGSCTTPEIAIKTDGVLAGATVIVKAVVEPLPLKVSVTNDWYRGLFPIYIDYAVYVPLVVNVWIVLPPTEVMVPPVPRCAPA
jgi:hypothetical protein